MASLVMRMDARQRAAQYRRGRLWRVRGIVTFSLPYGQRLIEGSLRPSRWHKERESSRCLLTQRDEIITLLARGDPAAADRLSDLYGSYREIMN